MLEKLLENIAKALEASGISYMVVGGQAVLLYGEPRLTKDIDITLDLGPESLEKLRAIIENLCLKVLVRDVEDFVNKTFVLPALDEESGFRVDFIFSLSLYEKEAMQRVKTVKVGEAKVKFASLEDLIIHKIIAFRPRDIEDIKNILLKNSDFDKEYILKWLKEFSQSLSENFKERFEKVLEEIK